MKSDVNIFCCLVTGDIAFRDKNVFQRTMDQVLKAVRSKYHVMLVSGTKPGADTLARWYAVQNKLPFIEFKPDRTRFGKRAEDKALIDMCNHIKRFPRGGVISFCDPMTQEAQKLFSLTKGCGDNVRYVPIDPNHPRYGRLSAVTPEMRQAVVIEPVMEQAEEEKKIVFPKIGLTEDFVILDTETTGTSKADEVVELAVLASSGKTLYHSYFYPKKEVNEGARKINGLTRSKLKGYPLFISEWDAIHKAIGGRMIMGHNIAFDKRMVIQTLASYQYDTEQATQDFSNTIDSMHIAKQFLDSANGYSLNVVSTLVGVDREEQHNAEDDCLMTVEFLQGLEDALEGKRKCNALKEDEEQQLSMELE